MCQPHNAHPRSGRLRRITTLINGVIRVYGIAVKIHHRAQPIIEQIHDKAQPITDFIKPINPLK